MNLKYDSKVQITKIKVLTEVAKEAWKNSLLENMVDIPSRIIPGPKPMTRCCIYKERAIVAERVKMAIGGNRNNKNIIEVIELACDECPVGGYVVTDICRGCLGHKCEEACMFKAITFQESGRALINKDKCKECGMCAKACPYSAIYDRKRPCENACKIKAISKSENGAAHIDDSKCVSCGACMAQCPFGAMVDKSFILNVIDLIKKSDNNKKYKVYAMVAPAISSQMAPAKLGQVHSAMKKLGFHAVLEAALGADVVAMKESKELAERGGKPLTSSCCPAFVKYIQTAFPQLASEISHNYSPMAQMAKLVKEDDPNCKIVFVGPCTAKKMEVRTEKVAPYVDEAMTFEELVALFDSKNIDVLKEPNEPLNLASYYGRVFGRTGGLTEAVVEALKEQEIDFEATSTVCQGLDQCKMALTKLANGKLDTNFIEGMACTFGCAGGAGNLTRNERNIASVTKHAQESGDIKLVDTTKGLIR